MKKNFILFAILLQTSLLFSGCDESAENETAELPSGYEVGAACDYGNTNEYCHYGTRYFCTPNGVIEQENCQFSCRILENAYPSGSDSSACFTPQTDCTWSRFSHDTHCFTEEHYSYQASVKCESSGNTAEDYRLYKIGNEKRCKGSCAPENNLGYSESCDDYGVFEDYNESDATCESFETFSGSCSDNTLLGCFFDSDKKISYSCGDNAKCIEFSTTTFDNHEVTQVACVNQKDRCTSEGDIKHVCEPLNGTGHVILYQCDKGGDGNNYWHPYRELGTCKGACAKDGTASCEDISSDIFTPIRYNRSCSKDSADICDNDWIITCGGGSLRGYVCPGCDIFKDVRGPGSSVAYCTSIEEECSELDREKDVCKDRDCSTLIHYSCVESVNGKRIWLIKSN